MESVELTRAEWLQVARHRLETSSYVLNSQGLAGLPVVLFKRGHEAQQQELNVQTAPLQWQYMGVHAAMAAPAADLADTEFCIVGGVQYKVQASQLGRGKRKLSGAAQPFLRLLLVRQGVPAGADLGVWVEHHVHLNLPDFIICRERYEASLSMPYLPQQRVKMLWKDATEPSKGQWYSGMVVQEAKEYGPHPQAVWEGVSVMWDTDGSITHVSPWELLRLPHEKQPHLNAQQAQQRWPLLQGQMPHQAPAASFGLHARAGPPQMPLYNAGLQLRPTLQAPVKPLNLNPGPDLAQRQSSLAEPGSGVSADTPGTLPWGQQSQGDRMLGDSSQYAQIVAQAQISPVHHTLAHPYLGDTQLPGGYPSPSSRPYPAFGLPNSGSFPLQSNNQPQNSANALRGNDGWAMPSALAMGQGRGVGEDEEQGGEGYIGVRTLPSKAGVVVYMANLVDPMDNNKEHTIGVFATAKDAAKAYDAAALRFFGPIAEGVLNFPMTSYPDVLAELRSYRRTNSTDDMDSPRSLADSPLDFDLRSQSLVALGLALSPQAQRQMLRPSPSKHAPHMAPHIPPSRPSSSRLAALVDQIPVPEEQEFPANSGARKPGRPRQKGSSRQQGSSRQKGSSRQRAAAVSQTQGLHVNDEHEVPAVSSNPDQSGLNSTALSRQPSVMMVRDQLQEEEELAAGVDEEEEEEEAESPAHNTRGKRKMRLRLAAGNDGTDQFQNPANPETPQAGAHVEEDWAPSTTASGKAKRNLKVKKSAKKKNVSADARVVAARRAVPGGRKRSDKLIEFSGVTLKNGRIAVMLWNSEAKKPLHLGYWPSTLAAARIADKARLTGDFKRNLREAELNFPLADYTSQELPATIAQLADYIKEEQGAARAAGSALKAQERGLPAKKRAATARSVDTSKPRYSHFLGVSWHKQSQKWQARFKKPEGSCHLIGSFQEEEEAGRAYDEYALQHHGNIAVRNNPPSTYTGNEADDAESYWRIRQEAAISSRAASVSLPSTRQTSAAPISTAPSSAFGSAAVSMSDVTESSVPQQLMELNQDGMSSLSGGHEQGLLPDGHPPASNCPSVPVTAENSHSTSCEEDAEASLPLRAASLT